MKTILVPVEGKRCARSPLPLPLLFPPPMRSWHFVSLPVPLKKRQNPILVVHLNISSYMDTHKYPVKWLSEVTVMHVELGRKWQCDPVSSSFAFVAPTPTMPLQFSHYSSLRHTLHPSTVLQSYISLQFYSPTSLYSSTVLYSSLQFFRHQHLLPVLQFYSPTFLSSSTVLQFSTTQPPTHFAVSEKEPVTTASAASPSTLAAHYAVKSTTSTPTTSTTTVSIQV